MTGFDIELYNKINAPVLLYSPQEKRAWLVSYVSVLLQLARARAENHSFLGCYIPACVPQGNGGQAAYDCLRACYRNPLRKAAENQTLSEGDQAYTVEEYVRNIMVSMDKAVRETSRAKHIFRTFREKIVGYELADIANTATNVEMKEYGLDMLARSSWAPLLDEVEAAFFYESLSDPIIPSSKMIFEGHCGRTTWRKVPSGYNLLTASVPCLHYLARRRNPVNSTMQLLTGEKYWHCRDKTYKQCHRDYPHTCDRLQELSSSRSARDPKILVSEAATTGAVVFRYADAPGAMLESTDRQLVVRTRPEDKSRSERANNPRQTERAAREAAAREAAAPTTSNSTRPRRPDYDSGYYSYENRHLSPKTLPASGRPLSSSLEENEGADASEATIREELVLDSKKGERERRRHTRRKEPSSPLSRRHKTAHGSSKSLKASWRSLTPS